MVHDAHLGAGAMARGLACFTAAAALCAAAPALADTNLNLQLGQGWQFDSAPAMDFPSADSAYDFVVPAGSVYDLRVVDSYIYGDIYTLTWAGGSASTTFTSRPNFTGNTSGPNAYPFASSWLTEAYSGIELAFGAGTYAVQVVDSNCGGGCPAGFGYRIDAGQAVPEPGAWGLMIVGVGLFSASMRWRRRHARPARA